jgi:spore coat-associated protein N
MGVSTLAATISAPLTADHGGLDAGRLLRSLLSLFLAAAILAFALPVAFGKGLPAGADPAQILSPAAPASIGASGGAGLSASGLVPGQSRATTIRVANTGGSAAAFSLGTRLADRVAPGGAPLSRALVVSVRSARTGAALYRGSLAALSGVRLGTIAAGAARAYRVAVALPEVAGNSVAGSALAARLVWSAS